MLAVNAQSLVPFWDRSRDCSAEPAVMLEFEIEEFELSPCRPAVISLQRTHTHGNLGNDQPIHCRIADSVTDRAVLGPAKVG